MSLLLKYIYVTLFLSIITFTSDCLSNEFCVIIDNQIELKSDYYEQAETVYKFNNNSFAKAFDILDRSKGYIKINYNNNSSGWFKPKPLIEKNNKKTYSNILINKSSMSYILADKRDQLTRKAIIVNQISENKSITEIPIYANPQLYGNPVAKITIFELRYIFSETDKSVLIAKSDRITKSNSSLRITGWIDKKFLYEWNTRIGIEFNKDNYSNRKQFLGKVFYQETHMMQFLDGNKDVDPLSVEESTEKPMPFYANRFPLLKVKNHNGKNYYNVAYIGGGGAGKGQYISKKHIESEKFKLEQILQDKTLKIAILIDATKGMGKHINNVRQALIAFFSNIRSNKDKAFYAQVAICVYRDYPDKEYIFEILNTFTDKLEILKASLNSIKTKSNQNDKGVGTYPEALFYGIHHTIKNTNNQKFSHFIKKQEIDWENFNFENIEILNSNNTQPGQNFGQISKKTLDWKSSKAEKFIILIGDHGNHEGYSQYPEDKKYNEINIRNMLDQNRISLYAVQVNISPKNSNMYHYNKMFEKQIYRIIGNDNVFGKLYRVKENSQSKVLKTLKDIIKNRLYLDEIIYSAREGTLEIDGYRGPFIQKVLKRYDINPEIFKAVQGCSLSYVSKLNEIGLVQVKEKVLIEKEQIELLKTQLTRFAGQLVYFNSNDSKKDELMEIIKKLVKNLTGDEPDPGEIISEFIERKTGIPIQTKLLDQSIEELTNKMYESEDRRFALNKELKTKVLKLEEVIKEKVLEDIIWDEENKTFEWNEGNQELNYFFSLEQPIPERDKGNITSKKNSAWIPIEYLP